MFLPVLSLISVSQSPVDSEAVALAMIVRSVQQGLDSGPVVLDVAGSERLGSNTPQTSQFRFFTHNGLFVSDGFVDNARKQSLVGDGTKVWRYDSTKNEYSYVAMPSEWGKAVGIAAAWSRSEFQRPLRLLSGSVRWLVRPSVVFLPNADEPIAIRLSQIRPLANGDWRGTIMLFEFEGYGKRLVKYTIQERLDAAGGQLRQTHYQAVFAYPDTLNVHFQFVPPAGARPSADLPPRSGGT